MDTRVYQRTQKEIIQSYNLLLPSWPHLTDCKIEEHKVPGEYTKYLACAKLKDNQLCL